MYTFKVSNRKGKKYDVFKDGIYLVSFGGIRSNGIPYDQYYDKIGKYSKYNHLDESRDNDTINGTVKRQNLNLLNILATLNCGNLGF